MKKNNFTSLFASMLAFVGTMAIVTPTCLGWFYEPEKPGSSKMNVFMFARILPVIALKLGTNHNIRRVLL